MICCGLAPGWNWPSYHGQNDFLFCEDESIKRQDSDKFIMQEITPTILRAGIIGTSVAARI